MRLADEILERINRQVYARFPELDGARAEQKPAPSGPNVILTYRRKCTTEDGFRVERVVRATIAPDGQVVKMSTSR
jgi:hypothetical protein